LHLLSLLSGELAAGIEQARGELARGEARRGTVEDLMSDLAESTETNE
jgi:hypothetical protein